jgi:hypothetical protein
MMKPEAAVMGFKIPRPDKKEAHSAEWASLTAGDEAYWIE